MASQTLAGVLRYLSHLASTNDGDGQSDSQLLHLFVTKRDESAFAALLHRHGSLVFGVCRQVLGDLHDAEDAFQATFLVLARQAASIRRHQSLAGWLHRVAINIARTARTGTAQRRTHERQAVLMGETSVVDEVVWRDWQPILHEEVDLLPEKYRVPIVLCYLEGKTHDEAARELGWPLGTVKGRLARARDLLRTRLARRGLALTGAGVATLLAESLAAAAVPPALLGLTLRAAVSFAAGGTLPGTTGSAEALALAKAALQTSTGTKLLHMVALILAVGLTTFALVAGTAPEAQRADSPPPLPQQAAAKPSGADIHGDPLPPGALARLGTIRFRTEGTALAFLPGDTTLLAVGAGFLSTWEVSTGKDLYRCRCASGGFSFALAPDGKTLAVGMNPHDLKDVAISLRDVATGCVLREFRGHTDQVRSLAFTADGRTLVSGSHDKTVRYQDVASGKEVRRFDEPDGVLAIALAPDGKTLATTTFQSTNSRWTVRIRDGVTGRELRHFQTDKPVFHLVFSPDGKTLVALAPENGGNPTSTIHLWDVATGKLRHLSGQSTFLYSAAFTPDSKTLATGSDQGIVLWDVVTAKERGRLGGQSAYPPGVTFSSDGKLLASVGNGTIRLWDVATGKERPARAEGHQGAVLSLVFLPDGKTLASAGRDHTLRLWEAGTSRPAGQHLLPGRMSYFPSSRFTSDGSTLAWLDGSRIGQVNVATGKPVRSFDFPEVVWHFALAPDGKFLAAYGRDRILRLVDRVTGKVVREFSKKNSEVLSGVVCLDLAFAPDGPTLAVGLEGDDNGKDAIGLLDTTTGKQRALRWQKAPVAFAFSPDGKTLSVALADNRLVLVEIATGKERLALRLPGHAARLVYSPDGKLLALGTEKGAIHLWDLATGKEVRRLAGHRGGVCCLAFSADGRRLASGGEDTTVLIWDIARSSK